MAYVDGFLLAVPKKKLADYKRMAQKAGKVWMEHGAVEYMECVGDDVKAKWGMPKAARLRAGETAVFSWILYKSKAHRDAVNKKVMADPRLKAMCDPTNMPFDMKRMAMGGFKVLVEA